MSKCTIVGDINIDIITPPFPLPQQWGESSIVLDNFNYSIGGCAANVTLELAALGADHKLFCAIGDGPISSWIQKECSNRKANISFYPIEGATAGVTFAMTFLDGKRQFVATIGTNALFELQHINEKEIYRSDHLHRAGFWYTPRLLGSPTINLMKHMINEGKETSLDVGWDPAGFPKPHQEILYNTLEYTQYFFANERELTMITGKTRLEEALDEILGISTHVDKPVIIVHQGSRGSLIKTRHKTIKIPTREVPQNNPTGTGDIYNAGFINGLLNGNKLKDCGQIADRLACIHLADKSKIYPSKNDLEKGKFFKV